MKAVIWGLLSSNHTSRYVHSAFHDAFSRLGWESLWVDDNEKNADLVTPGTWVFSLGSHARHLPKVKGARYVLHNFDSNSAIAKSYEHLNLQVYTHQSKGQRVGESLALFDSKSRTLYQPWGLPDRNAPYLSFNPEPSNVEHWIGSIWNNALAQGNQKELGEYRAALPAAKIEFAHAGSQRIKNSILSFPLLRPIADWYGRMGEVGEQEAQTLIHESPVGAAIVGSWQREVGYLPCRLFKNLSAGQPIFSNSNFSDAFGEFAVHSFDIAELVEWRLSLTNSKGQEMVKGAQAYLDQYTYQAAVKRILEVF